MAVLGGKMTMMMVAAALELLVIAVVIGGGGGKWMVEAQEHHVIGGDRGWEPSTDLQAWSDGRVFKVGDNIWFAYSAAEEIVAELNSKEDFDTCDVSNPIKMYTDGLNRVILDGEGSRYFVSGTPETCKNGLKLHVQVVQPSSKSTGKEDDEEEAAMKVKPATTITVMAAAPTSSDSSNLRVTLLSVLLALLLSYSFGF